MLTLTIPARQYFDERTQRFVDTSEYVLELEHSLVSLSKWESKWEKPFLGKNEHTIEQTIDYIRCMTLNEVSPEAYTLLDDALVREVVAYMEQKMTATFFNATSANKPSNEIITAEIIYYWMVSSQVPFECQYWHLNRLMTLLRVISQKNNPGKKMSKAEVLARNRQLNAERRAQMKTSG